MSQNLHSTCCKVSIAIVFMLFFQLSKAQYDFSQLDAKFQQYQHALADNVVMLVYKDGKIIYSKQHGDLTPATQAPIGASSKWLTTALVMTFVDEGKISLDDKVSKYLPIFAMYGKSYVTIRQCLSHFTGIESDKPTVSMFKPGHYASLEEEVNALASKHEIQTNPGTEFWYSNTGVNIAARVLEIVGKRSFEQLMQSRLLRPLGMRNTTFQFDFDKAPNPSGGALSSAADYLNFLSMLLNKGMFKDKRVLSEKAIADMEQVQTTGAIIKYAPEAAKGFGYALGAWVLEQDGNGKTTSLSGIGLFGDWPVIDICRGYASIIFVKGLLLAEQKKDMYMDIKAAIDAQITCSN